MQAEQGVLGCILQDPQRAMPEVQAALSGDMAFYDLKHREVYAACVALTDAGTPIDTISLRHAMAASGKLEQVGGDAFLGSLIDATPSAANVAYYLEILTDQWQLRRMIIACTGIVSRILDQNGLATVIDDAERDVLAVRLRKGTGTKPIKELVAGAVDEIERNFASGGLISGLSTGLIDLDKMTSGLHAGEMTALAAYPGNGKTSLALNIAEHAILEEKLPVGIFSLEMSAQQLVLRMLSSRARVNLRNVGAGKLTNDDFQKLTLAAAKISASFTFLDDVSSLSIQQLRASARRMKQQHDVRLILVDYIQLIGSSGNRRDQNREQEVSEISRGLKAMAMELRVPVLALSQLNDDGKLRESRAIGQDADNVWLIEPAEDADQNSSKKGEENIQAMAIKLKKQRNGPTGKIHVTFLKCFTRFEGASKVRDEDIPESRKPYGD